MREPTVTPFRTTETYRPEEARERADSRVPLFNRRGFRLATGVALIALAALVALPRMFSYAAEDAVVQGRTATLRTPIEGEVRAMTVKAGDPVRAGEALASIVNPRLDESFLNELRTERDSLSQRIAALDEQAAGLRELRGDLQQRTAVLKSAAATGVAREIDVARADLAAIRAELAAAESELTRQTTLAAKGHVTDAALERVRATRDTLAARLDATRARVAKLDEEKRQAEAGIFVADGRYGAPYTEIRGDEIAITLLDIAARRQEQKTRVAEIERQIAAERTRLSKAGFSAMPSPHDGVVWKVLTPADTDVVIGTEVAEVLDCASTFLEIRVSEGRFESTRKGDELRYRLIGQDEFRTATVFALRGGQAVGGDRSLAAAMDARGGRDFRVWAELAPQDANAREAAFCNVGRHADVRFPNEFAPLGALKALWNVL